MKGLGLGLLVAIGVALAATGALAAPAPAAPSSAPTVSVPSDSSVAGFSMADAVSIALARNRDVIAAKMDIEAAELEVVAARVYPNPSLQYSVGNLVLGGANGQMGSVSSPPGMFGQTVHAVGIA